MRKRVDTLKIRPTFRLLSEVFFLRKYSIQIEDTKMMKKGMRTNKTEVKLSSIIHSSFLVDLRNVVLHLKTIMFKKKEKIVPTSYSSMNQFEYEKAVKTK